MSAPASGAPDDGPAQPNPTREHFGDYRRVVGRSFRLDQNVWSVVAVTAEHLADLGLPTEDLLPELAGGWLSFEYGSERRRLAPIPHGWETIGVEELVELCRRAKPTRRGQPR